MAKQTLRCPNCKKSIGTIDDEYLYGSPIRTCPKCQKIYHDPRYHEIALEGVKQNDIAPDSEFIAKKRKGGVLSILGGVGVFVAFILLIIVGWIFYFFPVISVMLLSAGIKSLSETTESAIEKKRLALESERQLSMARMQNPIYKDQLRSLGYNVPN